jgi:hypothetical protein
MRSIVMVRLHSFVIHQFLMEYNVIIPIDFCIPNVESKVWIPKSKLHRYHLSSPWQLDSNVCNQIGIQRLDFFPISFIKNTNQALFVIQNPHTITLHRDRQARKKGSDHNKKGRTP